MTPHEILPHEKSIAYIVRDITRLFARTLEIQIEPYGITISQYYYLRVLWEEEGLSQRELSKRVGTREPSTVTALRSLEKEGLIRRVRNKKDGRIINISLTRKGKNLEEKLLPIAAKLNYDVLSTLSPKKQEMLWSMMRDLKTKLEHIELSLPQK